MFVEEMDSAGESSSEINSERPEKELSAGELYRALTPQEWSSGWSRSISHSESAATEHDSDPPSDARSPDTICMSSSSSKWLAVGCTQPRGVLMPILPAGMGEVDDSGCSIGWMQACCCSQSRIRLTNPSPLSSILRCNSPNAVDRNRTTSCVGGCEARTCGSETVRGIGDEW